jgi:hypothetical protein
MVVDWSTIQAETEEFNGQKYYECKICIINGFHGEFSKKDDYDGKWKSPDGAEHVHRKKEQPKTVSGSPQISQEAINALIVKSDKILAIDEKIGVGFVQIGEILEAILRKLGVEFESARDLAKLGDKISSMVGGEFHVEHKLTSEQTNESAP